MRATFQGINVAIIDVWQMTSCHYSKENIHPNPTVIRNEIDFIAVIHQSCLNAHFC
uniref:NXPE C-terminal domain-containing protein n=1 Tax=Anguilla anguilla TaxID=7936 RepID=A0A0E9VFH5_ANGAN